MAKSPEEQHHAKATGWAARTQLVSSPPSNFPGGQLGIKMRPSRCCIVGSCHSDLHKIENEWGNTICSSLLGHEIVGVVTEIGSKVQKFKVGDKVGVGCMVGSCLSCDNCTNHLEKYCPKIILTCGSTYHDGTPTYGGYSDLMVADEHFGVRIPDNLPLDGCPSLLCAGITTYSPLKYYGLDKSVMHLGVVGLGGLGHAAVKFALKVTVVSTSPGKKEEATQRLGADSFLTGRELSQIQVTIATKHYHRPWSSKHGSFS